MTTIRASAIAHWLELLDEIEKAMGQQPNKSDELFGAMGRADWLRKDIIARTVTDVEVE